MKPPTTRDLFRLKRPARQVYVAMALNQPLPHLESDQIAVSFQELLHFGFINLAIVGGKAVYVVYVPCV